PRRSICTSMSTLLSLRSFIYLPRPPTVPTLFPYTTLFRSVVMEHRFTGRSLLYRLARVPLSGVNLIAVRPGPRVDGDQVDARERSEEHTSELQSPDHLVCRLLLEKKNKTNQSKSVASCNQD